MLHQKREPILGNLANGHFITDVDNCMLKHHGLRGASREFRYFNIGVITGRENLGNLI